MKTVSEKPLSKLGIGTYGIGGRGHRDIKITEKQSDQKYIEAITYSLRNNLNFAELSLGYGQGNSISLFKKALDKSRINRKDLFLTLSLYPRDITSINTIKQDIQDFYKIMKTNYADSTLVTQSLILRFGEKQIYKILNNLLKQNKTRYVSLSNAGPKWIKKFKKQFGNKFFAHEGHISFEIRTMQDKKIFETCKQLDVTSIIWRPLRRNHTANHNWGILNKLLKKYKKTQNQIILNWISELGYHPMVFSANKNHIKENINSLNFKMSNQDYDLITQSRPFKYNQKNIDWNGNKVGTSILNLEKDIDEHLIS